MYATRQSIVQMSSSFWSDELTKRVYYFKDSEIYYQVGHHLSVSPSYYSIIKIQTSKLMQKMLVLFGKSGQNILKLFTRKRALRAKCVMLHRAT